MRRYLSRYYDGRDDVIEEECLIEPHDLADANKNRVMFLKVIVDDGTGLFIQTDNVYTLEEIYYTLD